MTSGDQLAEALAAAYPELAEVGAAAPEPVYLVGGAVRDLLLGRGRADIDLVVEGDPAALAAALGAKIVESHARFGTFKLALGGVPGSGDAEVVDVASSRRESYVRPGALPTVELGAPIRTDLARRDFTVNAMAVALAEPRELIDPYDGQVDLEAGVLRVIHPGSFVDDPTRAIRAARYAARFGFGIEPGTRELLQAADLATVTPERRGAELRKLAEEDRAVRGLELLAGWGLIEPRRGRRVLRPGPRRRPPDGRPALVGGGRSRRGDPCRRARSLGGTLRRRGPGEPRRRGCPSPAAKTRSSSSSLAPPAPGGSTTGSAGARSVWRSPAPT